MSLHKPANEIVRAVKKVGQTVVTIENLRSRLFTKQLPPLFVTHNARSLIDGPVTWVVVTSNAEFLKKIAKVQADNLDPNEFLKFYDIDGIKLPDTPSDIVALYNTTGLASTQPSMKRPENVNDN
jgi:hypothetical protein